MSTMATRQAPALAVSPSAAPLTSVSASSVASMRSHRPIGARPRPHGVLRVANPDDSDNDDDSSPPNRASPQRFSPARPSPAAGAASQPSVASSLGRSSTAATDPIPILVPNRATTPSGASPSPGNPYSATTSITRGFSPAPLAPSSGSPNTTRQLTHPQPPYSSPPLPQHSGGGEQQRGVRPVLPPIPEQHVRRPPAHAFVTRSHTSPTDQTSTHLEPSRFTTFEGPASPGRALPTLPTQPIRSASVPSPTYRSANADRPPPYNASPHLPASSIVPLPGMVTVASTSSSSLHSMGVNRIDSPDDSRLGPSNGNRQRSGSVQRARLQATTDNEQFVVVDITGIHTSEGIRERLFSKLRFRDEDHQMLSIYQTDIGEQPNQTALTNQGLLQLCMQYGDANGSLKFLVTQTSIHPVVPPQDPPIRQALPHIVTDVTTPRYSPAGHHSNRSSISGSAEMDRESGSRTSISSMDDTTVPEVWARPGSSSEQSSTDASILAAAGVNDEMDEPSRQLALLLFKQDQEAERRSRDQEEADQRLAREEQDREREVWQLLQQIELQGQQDPEQQRHLLQQLGINGSQNLVEQAQPGQQAQPIIQRLDASRPPDQPTNRRSEQFYIDRQYRREVFANAAVGMASNPELNASHRRQSEQSRPTQTPLPTPMRTNTTPSPHSTTGSLRHAQTPTHPETHTPGGPRVTHPQPTHNSTQPSFTPNPPHNTMPMAPVTAEPAPYPDRRHPEPDPAPLLSFPNPQPMPPWLSYQAETAHLSAYPQPGPRISDMRAFPFLRRTIDATDSSDTNISESTIIAPPQDELTYKVSKQRGNQGMRHNINRQVPIADPDPEEATLFIKPPVQPTDPSSDSESDASIQRGWEGENNWQIRPTADSLYENLQEFFPKVDIDAPIVDPAGLPTPSTPSSDSPRNPTEAQRPPPPQPPIWGNPASNARADDGPRNSVWDAVQGGIHAVTKGFNKPGNRGSIRAVANRRRQSMQGQVDVGSVDQGDQGNQVVGQSGGVRRSSSMWGHRVVEVTQSQIPPLIPESPSSEGRAVTLSWVKGKLIGKGSYGKVYLALNTTTGDMMAVKQVEQAPTEDGAVDPRQRDMVAALQGEITLLKDLYHTNIVAYLGCETSPEYVSIFLEYVPGGTIASIYRAPNQGRFEEQLVKFFTAQILKGLAYLHDKNIWHRDLKGDNILVDANGVCKISDFGISRQTQDAYDSYANGTSMKGSVFWMAPEIIQPQGKRSYSGKVDIWSLGCVVLEMLTGARPWSEVQEQMHVILMLFQGRTPGVPRDVHFSHQAYKFMFESCLVSNPNDRPTAIGLLQHEFLTDRDPEWTWSESKIGKAVARRLAKARADSSMSNAGGNPQPSGSGYAHYPNPH